MRPGRRAVAALAIALLAGVPARAQEPVAEAPVRVHLVPESRAEVRGPAPAPGPDNLRGSAPTVGDRFWVTVQTSGPPGYGLLPRSLVEALDARPEVHVTDTDRRDGRLRLEIAAFRPGDAPLPAVEAAVVDAAGDTLRVPVSSDSVRVAAVLAPADTVLADIKPLWIDRGIPTWVWWLLAGLVLGMLLLLRWWRRRGAREPAETVRDREGAYAAARRRIERLRAEPDGPEGRIGATAGIGDALRGYLAEGWGLPARERTTFELLADAPEHLARDRSALGALLSRADLAKFARVDPGHGSVPELGERALETLERIESTRAARATPPDETVANERPREAAS